MHNAFLGVKPVTIEWRENTSENSRLTFTPYSPLFDDIYFNSKDGLAESEYVFLKGNNLAQRFANLKNSKKDSFVIFETGFGTGLNFLLSCELWQKSTNTNNKSLHYYSVEQFPLKIADLKKAYQNLNLETELTETLLKHYPPALPGIYTIQIKSTIHLHLILLPIDKALKEVAVQEDFKVDAWFLDGFAPSKNPDMWHKGLLHFMALHAENNDTSRTTVATFTAASAIRKGLQHYGFEVTKQKGFAQKREMITAQFIEKKLSTPKPTLASSYLQSKKKSARVAIIGAGLAGCSTAYWLHKQNIDVEIFEQRSWLADAASKMPALLATPNLSLDHNAFSQLTFQGFYTLAQYLTEQPRMAEYTQCLQLTSDKYSQYQLDQYAQQYRERINNQQSNHFQWHQTQLNEQIISGLALPAFQLNGQTFCQSLVSNINEKNIHYNTSISSLEELSDFNHIILATGHNSLLNNLGIEHLPTIMPLRGQLTTVNNQVNIEAPINYNGQLFKTKQQLVLGATFHNSVDENIWPQDQEANLQLANTNFDLNINPNRHTQDYVGIRASSYDRFPFTGILSTQNRQTLWTNYGFGTRGLCLSLLCGQIIANSISHQTLPLTKNLLARLSPLRVNR
ncbi:MAG: tRNA (5-methylaminomethyl-2-thiouridine)(34)-methyltransferase MnmD [Kangiellaceae bacterium]|nr:tRNA (5-methylaminomethyl-2-thiouridine)(34)-methyltransferase MnmD [Kangiellaceae bacterium]